MSEEIVPTPPSNDPNTSCTFARPGGGAVPFQDEHDPLAPRPIEDHMLDELNRSIEIMAIQPRGAGGANYLYKLEGPVIPRATPREGWAVEGVLMLKFQDGPIKDGMNGITNEALLAVLIDRLRGFQMGPYKCAENAMVLDHLESALEKLHRRTFDRLGQRTRDQ